MKILLPLAALGLLSTLFLISRNIDPTQQTNLANIDLEQRAHDQGATKPSFAGVTTGGDEVTFLAQTARPDANDPEHLMAQDVTARMKLLQGTVIDITSTTADFHQSRYTASLKGNVQFLTSNGYQLHTERLNTRFDHLYAESPGQVEGTGPPGDLTAGRMILSSEEENGITELLFTDGVNLIYQPHKSKE